MGIFMATMKRVVDGCAATMGSATGWIRVASLLAAVAIASPASADWRLYVSGDLGYSVADADASGSVNFPDPAPDFPIRGDDTDVSPLLGGAFGVAIPMNEAAPIEMPRGWRLPDWDMRVELEAVGLREYDFKTTPLTNNTGPIVTEVDIWSLTSNFWLDVPMRGLYRPISWTSSRLFGRWRLRSLKYVLDRTTLNMGVGIGVANLDAKTTEDTSRGSDDTYNFAWQAGVGLGYQVSERVNLSLGYRYIDPGDAEYDLEGTQLDPNENSSVKIDPEIHEARATVRIEIWDFAMPWR